MTPTTLNKLNVMLNCDPSHCAKAGCPNFNQDTQGCEALRTLKVIQIILEEKFKEVTKDDEK